MNLVSLGSGVTGLTVMLVFEHNAYAMLDGQYKYAPVPDFTRPRRLDNGLNHFVDHIVRNDHFDLDLR